jgi:hypothetical protein
MTDQHAMNSITKPVAGSTTEKLSGNYDFNCKLHNKFIILFVIIVLQDNKRRLKPSELQQ